MAYKYKLREEEAEATPSNREQVNYDIVVTPNSVSVEDTVKALETLDNYGMYVSNMRNKSSIQKAIEDHFGPVIPAKRKKMERDQGFLFPVKTKTSIDDFVKSQLVLAMAHGVTLTLCKDNYITMMDKSINELFHTNLIFSG